MSWTTWSASTRTWTSTCLAVVAAPAGAVVAKRRSRRTRAAIARRCASPTATRHGARVWAIEGTGSYGAGLARYLAGRGERCSRSAARRAASVGCAARTTRSTRSRPHAQRSPARRSPFRAAGERREALRLLLVARRSAVDVRREALGQLRGVIVTAPDRLREELRRLPAGRLLERCSRLRRSSSRSADELATRLVLRSLARRIEAATSKPPSSNTRSSRTSARSRRGCSTSRASDRSSPRN